MRIRTIFAVAVMLALLGACVPATSQHTVDVSVSGLEGFAPAGQAGPDASRALSSVTTVKQLRATGAAQFNSTVAVAGATTVDDLTVGGDADVTGDVDVTGDMAVDGTLTASTIVSSTGSLALSGDLTMTAVNAAGGSANPIDWTGTLGNFNGSDDFTAIDLNFTNGTHSSTGNTVQGLDISAISGSANATETAVKIGTGWDAGVNLSGTPLVIGADGGVTLDETSDDVVALTTGAGAGTVSILVGNLKVGNGSPGTAQDGEDAYIEGGFEVDGTAKLDGATNIAGAVTAASSVSTGTWAKLAQQTAFSMASGGTITPTGTNQPIITDGAYTCSTTTCIADGATAGDLLILRNANATNAITIDGTGGNVECKTDKTLGAQDTLVLIWNGNDWVCIGGPSDNS